MVLTLQSITVYEQRTVTQDCFAFPQTGQGLTLSCCHRHVGSVQEVYLESYRRPGRGCDGTQTDRFAPTELEYRPDRVLGSPGPAGNHALHQGSVRRWQI